jgi:hypothetical protein
MVHIKLQRKLLSNWKSKMPRSGYLSVDNATNEKEHCPVGATRFSDDLG